MIIYQVYDETAEQARGIAARLKTLLESGAVQCSVVPSVINDAVRQSCGISQCPAIVRSGKVLWQGSEPAEELIRQWSEQHFAQCDQVEGANGNFGYDKTNPIPSEGNWYCRRLRCAQGHPFWYQRLWSPGPGPDGHLVDRVLLLCFERESKVSLFFDIYHGGHSSLVPNGLQWNQEPLGRGTMAGMVENFPEDLDKPSSQ